MQPSFDLFSILMLIGAAHGILLGFTLLSIHRGNRLANRILALALICFACGMAAQITPSRYQKQHASPNTPIHV